MAQSEQLTRPKEIAMAYSLSSKPKDINDAFTRFATMLGLDTYKEWKSHDDFGFRVRRELLVGKDGERDSIKLSRVGHKGEARITVCPDDPLATAGLIVTDEQGRRYVAHIGVFDGKSRDRDLFQENTKDDDFWVEISEVNGDRYLVTPLDDINSAELLTNVARFVQNRFVPYSTSEEPPMVLPSTSTQQRTRLNRIFHGPPGTGKTYDAVSEAVEVIDGFYQEDRERLTNRLNELRDKGRVEFVTFHQNYAYEDFIEGIRPILDKDTKELRYELRDGIFKQIAKAAGQCPNDNYVLIVDEINRGNIAKIFGELITLIEPSKRLRPRNGDGSLGREDIGSDELRATLPYSRDSFGVPDNLYLIGTMNTADRGIALLDVALRRRFEFIPRMPDANHRGISDDVQGVDCRKLLQAINDRIVENLDRDHQIGHTYFLRVKDLDELGRVFQTQVVPLLQEYFYDDWRKMRRVLNNNGFITPEEADEDDERAVFDVLPPHDARWQQARSYRRIYTGDSDRGFEEGQ